MARILKKIYKLTASSAVYNSEAKKALITLSDNERFQIFLNKISITKKTKKM